MVPIGYGTFSAKVPSQLRPKATHVCLKKKEGKTRRRRRTCTREVENPLTGLSHFHYGNDTEPADEPVDPASEQNHMGPPGQFLTNLDSSGRVATVGLWSGILRV